MLESLNQVQTIQIGTEFYRLVEVVGEQPRLAWEETFEDENAFQGGTPNILSDPSETWHMGGFKSREGIPGTSESGMSTDARWPNRLLPAPEFNTITLTNSETTPTGFFEAFGWLFVIAGIRIFRINPADDSVVLSKQHPPSYFVNEGVGWDSQAIVALANDVQKLTALGSPDSWDTGVTGSVACRLAVGFDRLFKVDMYGVLKNLLSGGDPVEEAEWADEVQCGNSDMGNPPNSLVAYERTALVGKPEGLFGVGEEGKGIPLIRRMAPHEDNCKNMYVLEPHVLVPHGRGTFRYMPGFVESVGMEREVLNESTTRGELVVFTSDGQWVYAVLVRDATFNYLVVGRDRRGEEPSLGPIIWDTMNFLQYQARALHVSRLWDPPRLWAGSGYDAVYSILPAAGGIPDPSGTYRLVTSGDRYTYWYHFGDWKDKDFLKVDAVGKDCDDTTYWKISYKVDGAAWASDDVDGVEMRVDEDKLHTFILPSTAKGRRVQFKLSYVGAANTNMGQLIHFRPYAVPHSLKLRHYTLTLHLAGEARHDGGVEQRNSLDQLNDLNALAEDSTAVDFKGPWGDIKVHPKRLRTLEVRQEGHELPRFLVEFVAQKREES